MTGSRRSDPVTTLQSVEPSGLIGGGGSRSHGGKRSCSHSIVGKAARMRRSSVISRKPEMRSRCPSAVSGEAGASASEVGTGAGVGTAGGVTVTGGAGSVTR